MKNTKFDTEKNKKSQEKIEPMEVSETQAKSISPAAEITSKSNIDILINNGAVIEPISSIEKIDRLNFDKAVRVNYMAPTLLISYCWSSLIKNKGKVINILSGAAINPIEGWTAYCSTKAALHMVNQQTHLEGYENGISSIGISPGMVDTAMQGKIRASGINKVSKVRKEDLIDTKQTGSFALWCASSDADIFSGKMIESSADYFVVYL